MAILAMDNNRNYWMRIKQDKGNDTKNPSYYD